MDMTIVLTNGIVGTKGDGRGDTFDIPGPIRITNIHNTHLSLLKVYIGVVLISRVNCNFV